jgi:hypothetical protein
MSVASILNPATGQIYPQYIPGGLGTGIVSVNAETGPAISITGSAGITVSTSAPNTINVAGGGPGGLYLPLAGGAMDASPSGVINAHTIENITTLEGTPAGSGFDTTIITNTGNDLNLQAGSSDAINMDCGQLTITSQIRTEINGITVIQPPGGYTYPNNPEVGLTVKNWTNPVNGNQMKGCLIENTSADGAEAVGLEIISTQDVNNGSAYGMKILGTGDATTTNTTEGIYIEKTRAIGNANGITILDVAGSDVVGVLTDTLTAVNNAIGYIVSNPTSTAGNTTGVLVKSPTALQDCRGIDVGNMNGTNVWGAEFNNLTATGDARGVVVSGAQGNTSAIGVEINSTTANGGTAYGMVLNGVNANGLGDPATGIEIGNVSADANAIGLNASAINSTNGRATGILTTSINSAGGQDVYGVNVINATTAGTGFARGVAISQISAVGTGRTFGIDVNAVNGAGPTIGMTMNGISAGGASLAGGITISNVSNPTGSATGVSVNTITSQRSTGVDIANVVGNGNPTHGIRVLGTRTTNVPATSAYGGFFARAGAKNAGDNGQLLKVADGNLGLGVQIIDNINTNVLSDGGNMVIITAPAPPLVNIVAPPGGFESGHWFMITKVGAGAHQLLDTNAVDAFNAQAPGVAFNFGGGAFGKVLMFFNAGIWYANVF